VDSRGHCSDILRGDDNIRRLYTDTTDKGTRTLSYRPVRVVSYLSYWKYSQHT